MRLYELFAREQTITPQGTMAQGSSSPMPPTTSTKQSNTDITNKDPNKNKDLNKIDNTLTGQQSAQLKNTLNALKNPLSAAGGGNIDTNKLAQAIGQQNDPQKTMSPALVKPLQTMLPGIADALKDPQSAEMIKQAIKTGVTSANAAQQQNKAP
jgi:hypothetical protein